VADGTAQPDAGELQVYRATDQTEGHLALRLVFRVVAVSLARPVSVDPMGSVDLQACGVGLNLALAFPFDSQICFEIGIDVGCSSLLPRRRARAGV
jgi:hypothetical protein